MQAITKESNIWCYPGGPFTERGRPYFLNMSDDGEHLIYHSQANVWVLNINNPLDSKFNNSHTGKCCCTRMGHTGSLVASADTVGNIKVWDFNKMEDKPLWEESVGQGKTCNDIYLKSDGTKIAWVTKDIAGQFGKVFDIKKQLTVGNFAGQSNEPLTITHPENDANLMYTSGQDCKILVTKLMPTSIVESNTTHGAFVNCLRASPDGTRMVSVSTDTNIGLWTLGTGTEVIAKAHTGTIYCVNWFSDSKRFATASADKTIKVWNFDDKSCLYTLKVKETPTLFDMQNGVAVSDTRIASVSLDGSLNIWEYATLAEGKLPDRVLKFHTTAIMNVSADKNTLVSFGQGGSILKFEEGQTTATGFVCDKPCTGGFVFEGETYYVSYADLYKADFETKKINKIGTAASSITCIAYHNGELVIGDGKGGVTKFNGKLGDRIMVSKDSKKVNGIAYHNGHAVVADDNGVVTWVSWDKLEVKDAMDFMGGNRATAISACPGYVLVGDEKGSVHFIKMVDGEAPFVEKKIKHHYSIVNSISINEDHKTAYSVSNDAVLAVWDLTTITNKYAHDNAHRGTITSSVWWSAKKMLVTAGSECGLKGWNL